MVRHVAMSVVTRKQSRLLWWVHLVAGLMHIASAITLLALVGADSWQPVLTTSHEIWSETPCRNNSDNVDRCFEQLRSTRNHKYDVGIVCFIFAFWSGFIHLVTIVGGGFLKNNFVNIWDGIYKKDLKTGVSRLRWVDYVISASLMVTCIGIFAGVTDLYTLLLLAVVEALVVVLGAISEKSNTTKEQWLWYGVACIAYVALWAPILATFLESIDSIPSEEKAVKRSLRIGIGVFAGVYSGFAIIAASNIITKFKYFYKNELFYIILSLVSKTQLHWVLFFGLIGRGERVYNEHHTEGSSSSYDPDKVIIVAGSILGIGLVLAITVYFLWKRFKNSSGATWVTLEKEIIGIQAPSSEKARLIARKGIYVH